MICYYDCVDLIYYNLTFEIFSQKELNWDECPVVVELSPLVSYAGEGLKDLVEGKKFKIPLLLNEAKVQKESVASSL